MTLPNYLHAGQGRAGSTTLHFMLDQHPEIYLYPAKEAHFFNNDELHAKGAGFYAENYFSGHGEQKIVGDITPAYHMPKYMERIAEMLGTDIKISVCFRFPVARTISHYFFEAKLLQAPLSFEEALVKEPIYIDASLGGRSLKRMYELFPRENILPLIFERDIKANKSIGAYTKIENLLGLEHHEPKLEPYNKGFVPHITIAERKGRLIDFQMKVHTYNPGDVVIETLRYSQFYSVEVIENPSKDVRDFYAGYFEKTTNSFNEEEIANFYNRYFAEDVKLLKELLQDDLPEWGLKNFTKMSAPPMLPSRMNRSFAGHAIDTIKTQKTRVVNKIGRLIAS